MKALTISTIMFALGCTSTTRTQLIEDQQDAGTEEGSAGSNLGGSGGNIETGGAAGMEIDSGVAGSSSGGVAGSSSGTGGNAGTGSGGMAGMAGSAGSGGCIPKTCLTLAIELSNGDTEAEACGVIDDGCGNFIDCDDSCSQPYHSCGHAAPVNDGGPAPENIPTTEGTTNLCGGGCTRWAIPYNLQCDQVRTFLYVCSANNAPDITIPPPNGVDCVPHNNNPDVYNGYWCCMY